LSSTGPAATAGARQGLPCLAAVCGGTRALPAILGHVLPALALHLVMMLPRLKPELPFVFVVLHNYLLQGGG